MINGPFCQEDLTTLSVYALNIRALKYIKLKLTELKEIDKSTVLVGDFLSL